MPQSRKPSSTKSAVDEPNVVTGEGDDPAARSIAADGFLAPVTTRVEFQLPAAAGVDVAAVVGEFNSWDPHASPMQRAENGCFTAIVDIVPGHRYRYRFLTDDGRWMNDWNADAYESNDHGSEDSVIDLTDGSPRRSAMVTSIALDPTSGSPGPGATTESPRKRAARRTPSRPSTDSDPVDGLPKAVLD